MNELLLKYEDIINKLFEGDKWLKKHNLDSWESVKTKVKNGNDIYNRRINLVKEAEQIQRDLRKYREAKM